MPAQSSPSNHLRRERGLIFNIQRFSIQDGPGIRTTIFFKGCPLACPWCSNPESSNPYPEIILRDVMCIRCGQCTAACPRRAICITSDRRVIDFSRCDECLACAAVCPAHAIEVAGQERTIEQIMDVVNRDRGYYQTSGGGITLSGGEPLLQWRFARKLARLAKSSGLHIALDTSGYASWPALLAVAEQVDLVLYDFKHIDPDVHRRYTGVSNRRILENLRLLMQETHVAVWLRIPVIPTFNDSVEVLSSICAYLQSLSRQVEKISLLAFHQFGAGKYPALGRTYHWGDMSPLNSARAEELGQVLRACHYKVEVGR